MTEYNDNREDRIRGRRHKRKHARIARTRRQVLRYSFLVSLLVVGVAGFVRVSWSVVDPENDIKVFGNDVVSTRQVRRVLLPYLHKPIYTLDPKALELTIQSLPDVQKAFVRRYLFPRPHLVVNIMEEFPWASYSPSPEQPISAVISQTGRMIPVGQFPSVPQPALKIYGTDKIHFTENDVALWANWVAYISTQTQRPVEYVDLRKPANIEVRSGDLCLRLGSADSLLSKRLSRLPSVLPVLATLSKENIEYVDLSLDSNVPLKVSKLPKKTAAESASQSGSIGTVPVGEVPPQSVAQTGSPPL